MFAALAHLTLTTVSDPAKHHAYNEWHQLQHQPELLQQPGVAWGERWVRSPDCAAAGAAAAELADAQYLSLCWLRGPTARSLREYRIVAEQAVQCGRGPEPAWADPALDLMMVPLKGYVTQRVLLSAEALPFRPSRGAFAILSRFTGRDAAVEAGYHWYDQVRIPDLLTCPGAAGAWSFANRGLFLPDRDLSQPVLRLVLVFLDGDPLAFAASLADREAGWRAGGRWRDTAGYEEVLLSGPLRSIVPWRWDWFDRAAG